MTDTFSKLRSRLESEDLSTDEFAALIYDDSPIHLEEIAQAAMRIRRKYFGNTIKIYAPLYLSNSCVNECRYCSFNRSNDIERTTLSATETSKDADILIAQGHRHLLLVAGEDDKAVSIEYLEDIARIIHPSVASLAIEVGPTDEENYRRLSDAGIDGVTLYQETYNKDVYNHMHPSGPKADFEKRLASIESAGKAGMRFLGIGALLGLSDWRREAISLFNHARYLQKRFWKSTITVSVPRIRFAPEGFTVPQPVSDSELVRLIVSLKCALPQIGIVLSTREPAELRNNLLPLGISQMSAGSRTEPGGYANPSQAEEQFSIEDIRTPSEVAESLRTAGFDPAFKDWENCLHGGTDAERNE
jgi:2-iminoacetate synthase